MVRRPWSPAEVAILRDLWPAAARPKLEAALPGRAWHSIAKRAWELQIRRARAPAALRGVDRVFAQLRQARVRNGWTQLEVARLIGVHWTTVSRWETGRDTPCWSMVSTWARVLGYRLELAWLSR